MPCRERQHRSRNLRASIDMGLAQNSFFLGWWILCCVRCAPHRAARLFPSSFVPYTFVVYIRRKPFWSFCVFRRYGDGNSTAPYRTKLFVLPDSGVQAFPVQDLVRYDDFEFLVGLKGRYFRTVRSFARPWPLRASFGLTSIRLSCGRTFAVFRQKTESIGSVGVFFGLNNGCEVVARNRLLRPVKPFGSFCVFGHFGALAMFITFRGVAGRCSADKGDRGVLVFAQVFKSHLTVLLVFALLTRATIECGASFNMSALSVLHDKENNVTTRWFGFARSVKLSQLTTTFCLITAQRRRRQSSNSDVKPLRCRNTGSRTAQECADYTQTLATMTRLSTPSPTSTSASLTHKDVCAAPWLRLSSP